MKIESEPPLYVEGLSEVHSLLKKGESIVFIVPDKCKKTFVRHIKRINKSHDLLRNRRGVLSRLMYACYLFYWGMVNALLTVNNRELDHAFLVYLTSWKFISLIDGEMLSDNKVSIIYRGKRLEAPIAKG
ncbi:MAG: hypothetical protein EP323_05535 [Gammaproteobacteria bacterium]|nr:MAG: hypothetical protein EP323_05535 [Gammaproteobacteria bacterium]